MLNKYLKETTFRKLVLPIWPANWWIPDFSENQNLTLNQANLVGGLEHFLFFHILGIITPTDELIFFRGVGIPYTTNQCQKHTQNISSIHLITSQWFSWPHFFQFQLEQHISGSALRGMTAGGLAPWRERTAAVWVSFWIDLMWITVINYTIWEKNMMRYHRFNCVL